MVALDAATGRQLWSLDLAPGDPAYFYGPPNVAGGVVYATGGDHKIWALEAATGRSRWSGLVEFTGDESAVTAPVIANGVVYATTVDNRVYAFSSAGCHAVTCQPLWSAEINPDEYSTATRPLSVTGGAVYASAHPTGLARWAVPTAG